MKKAVLGVARTVLKGGGQFFVKTAQKRILFLSISSIAILSQSMIQ
jgi:hypothetical protein